MASFTGGSRAIGRVACLHDYGDVEAGSYWCTNVNAGAFTHGDGRVAGENGCHLSVPAMETRLFMLYFLRGDH